ncbi:MAG: hypothetical protein JW902_11125 [Syntrophaceae bacterium]|nr:hypothetical protein [Syntrophaceae bacterium]
MNVLFYKPMAKEASNKLLNGVLKNLHTNSKLEVHLTIDSLSHSLRQPREDSIIAVLLSESKKDLVDILGIKDLLSDVRVVLILPDRAKDTISKGHSLRPRFLSYSDTDYSEVGTVLNKMIKNCYSGRQEGLQK